MPKLSSAVDELPAQETYLKVPSAAKLANVHANTIWNWITEGKIPAVRIGSRIVRVRKSDLLDFLNSNLAMVDGQWLSIPKGR